MQHLAAIDQVGKGIAVAFVATLYGVGSANLLFLPCAGRVRQLFAERQCARELILDGVLAIVERETPAGIERQLSCFLPGAAVPRETSSVLS